MHVDKALQVIDFEDADDPVCKPLNTTPGVRNICTSGFFVLDELSIDGGMTQQADGSTFHVLFSTDAAVEITYGNDSVEVVSKGTSVLVPAALGAYTIRSREAIQILKTTVPIGI